MRRMNRVWAAAIAVVGLAAGGAERARAEGSVVVYCGVNEEWCRAAATAFEKQSGIHVDMTRQSAGELYARLRAEKDNPRGDIWFGGTGDPHLQAASDGLTEPYQSPSLGSLRDWAQNQAKRSGYRTVGLYLGALGFGYNSDDLAKRKIAAPACWADLIKPEFKGEVEMADPNSSGTAWTMLATIVQLMGEEQGVRLPQEAEPQHRPIHQRRRGARPWRSGRARCWSASRSSTTSSTAPSTTRR